MAELSERVRASLAAQEQYLTTHASLLARAGANLGAALARGNKLIALGCPTVAQHIVAELTGRFSAERPGLAALSLFENPSAVTAIANDYGPARVYARQLAALALPGDFVLTLVAGVDPAARAALEEARQMGLETLALEMPGSEEAVAAETFLTAAHLLCEAAEVELARLRPEWFTAGTPSRGASRP